MSEYAMSGSANRLAGSESELIKKIRQQPFVVLLLDEIEKAAPEVFDMLLGLFDEGRFTDDYGRVSSFRSAIIIMTSNLGVKTSGPIGFDAEDSGDYEREITTFFRPEFYNRLDEVITFTHLSQDHIHAITEKELRGITAREGFAKRELTISWSNEFVRNIAHLGYDKRYGARNLQRTIEEKIVIPLARYVLENPSFSKTQLMLDVDDRRNIQITSA
jgi:ATP-dependent Clp protease ATP-binding subunit ClpC